MDDIYGVLSEALSENKAKPSDNWKDVYKKATTVTTNKKASSSNVNNSQTSNRTSSGSLGNALAAVQWASRQRVQRSNGGNDSETDRDYDFSERRYTDEAYDERHGGNSASTASKGNSNS